MSFFAGFVIGFVFGVIFLFAMFIWNFSDLGPKF